MSEDKPPVLPYTAPALLRGHRFNMVSVAGATFIVHFVISIVLLFGSMRLSSIRFDRGTPPDFYEHVLNGTVSVLLFPIIPLFNRMNWLPSGVWGWLIFVLNSVVWSIVAEQLVALWPRRTSK